MLRTTTIKNLLLFNIKMEITILGTASMVPTKDRNHTAILIFHEKDSLLFDCGEGTQRQMKIAKADINRINKIFLSHWHGDHALGLPGLIYTLCNQSYDKTLHIYGPQGTKKHFKAMMEAFDFDNRIELDVHEVSSGVIYESQEYNIECMEMEHRVPTIGFSLIENSKRKMNLSELKKLGIPKGPFWNKLQLGQDIEFNGKKIKADEVTTLIPGKKITYVPDTAYCENAIKLAENADVLLSDSTFLSEKEEMAEDYGHLTAKQAAEIANAANVKKLVLTHFSQRYKTTHDLEEEAKTYFPNSVAAFDFMKIRI